MFENPTISLNALCNSCVKIACCSSELIFTFRYAGNSIQRGDRAIHLTYPPFICKLQFPSNPTNKNLTELGLAIQSFLPQYPFIIIHMVVWTFFFSVTKTLTFPSQSLCIYIFIYIHVIYVLWLNVHAIINLFSQKFNLHNVFISIPATGSSIGNTTSNVNFSPQENSSVGLDNGQCLHNCSAAPGHAVLSLVTFHPHTHTHTHTQEG
jgi:hypothetical protein